MNSLKVLVVDDHPIVLEGLHSSLLNAPEIALVTCCNTGESALIEVKLRKYDVILLDMRMAPMSGIDTLRSIRQIDPLAVVVFLSSYELDEEVFQALKEGAVGYINKGSTGAELLKALIDVSKGGSALSPALQRRVQLRRKRAELTPRELEILEMVAKGLTNKDIGRALRVSHFTVRNQFSVILTKLEVLDRTEAVRVAIEQGIIVL